MTLSLFPTPTDGKCLDGTPGGFYYEAINKSSTLWVIYMQGGGHCATKQECDSRVNGPLGSSNYWKPTMVGYGPCSTYPSDNPDFYYGHHVFIPYWYTQRTTFIFEEPSWNLKNNPSI